MEIQLTRIQNLQLVSKGMTRDCLARKLGYKDTNYLNQLLSGAGSFGTRTARKIEKKLRLPRGYLDDPRNVENDPNTSNQRELYSRYLAAPLNIQLAIESLLDFDNSTS